MVQWLALSPHSEKALGSIGSQGTSVWGLYVLLVSVWVLSRYSGFLPQSKNMQTRVRLFVHSKLPVGVNVIVDGCLSL